MREMIWRRELEISTTGSRVFILENDAGFFGFWVGEWKHYSKGGGVIREPRWRWWRGEGGGSAW